MSLAHFLYLVMIWSISAHMKKKGEREKERDFWSRVSLWRMDFEHSSQE